MSSMMFMASTFFSMISFYSRWATRAYGDFCIKLEIFDRLRILDMLQKTSTAT